MGGCCIGTTGCGNNHFYYHYNSYTGSKRVGEGWLRWLVKKLELPVQSCLRFCKQRIYKKRAGGVGMYRDGCQAMCLVVGVHIEGKFSSSDVRTVLVKKGNLGD